MANNGDNDCNEISQNAQKIVFAEDLMNYILQKYSIPPMSVSTELERKSCVSIFDENLKIAVDHCHNTIVDKTEEACHFMMQNNLNNILSFHYYAYTLRTRLLICSSYTESFFHYSVHLTVIAAKLYAREFKEPLRIAVHYIIDSLDIDLFVSRKVFLDRIAQNYADNLRQHSNTIQQPPPDRKGKSVVQAIDVQMCTPHGNLNRCEVTTENIHGDVFNMEKMKESIATRPLSFKGNPSYLGFETDRTHMFDHTNTNPDNASSSTYVGVPGSSSGDITNIYSQESYSVDSNGERKRTTKET